MSDIPEPEQLNIIVKKRLQSSHLSRFRIGVECCGKQQSSQHVTPNSKTKPQVPKPLHETLKHSSQTKKSLRNDEEAAGEPAPAFQKGARTALVSQARDVAIPESPRPSPKVGISAEGLRRTPEPQTVFVIAVCVCACLCVCTCVCGCVCVDR